MRAGTTIAMLDSSSDVIDLAFVGMSFTEVCVLANGLSPCTEVQGVNFFKSVNNGLH